MTRDEIRWMAWEAGFVDKSFCRWGAYTDDLERFVDLIEKHLIERLILRPEYMDAMRASKGAKATPLYTATPPARRPLTDDEIDEATAQAADALLDHIYEYGTTAEGVRQRIRKLARAAERAHGIGGAK